MMTYRTLLLTAAATAVLGLAACDQKAASPATGAPIASLPLAEAPPPADVAAPAPYANALPAAAPIRRAAPRRPVYSYVDDAYQLADAFGDSPPDYTIDYDGVRPYVWRSSGGEYRMVEYAPDGQREYYYRGDSDYPFLVRDSRYAYAYDRGELVQVYYANGRPYDNYAPAEADLAARYLMRARHLYGAAIHDQRQAAYAADWSRRRATVIDSRQEWAAEQQRNADWSRWRDQQARDQQAQRQEAAWRQERDQRQAYAARTAAVVAAAALAAQHAGPQMDRRDTSQATVRPVISRTASNRPASNRLRPTRRVATKRPPASSRR